MSDSLSPCGRTVAGAAAWWRLPQRRTSILRREVHNPADDDRRYCGPLGPPFSIFRLRARTGDVLHRFRKRS